MKFSDIEQEQWEELQPYLDTCLLPVTGMTGSESPYEATACLERLRDIMDLVEIPYKGRIVTYPASHYLHDREHVAGSLDSWCKAMREAGFKHVVLITASDDPRIAGQEADLLIKPQADGQLPSQSEVAALIEGMWSGQAVGERAESV